MTTSTDIQPPIEQSAGVNRPLAIVTGGSKRIGRGFCLALARAGWDIALHFNTSRNEAEATRAEIKALGAECALVQANLAERSETRTLIDQLNALDRVPNLLINNASAFRYDDAVRFDERTLELHLNVHVHAPLVLSQWFQAKSTGEQALNRSIINLVDQRVLNPSAGHFTYAVSKHALWAATKQMAMDFAPLVRVNAIAPGPVLPPPGSTGETFDQQQGAMLLERGPDVAEIAAAALYLINSPSITGTVLPVDGGQHLGYMSPGEARRFVEDGVKPG